MWWEPLYTAGTNVNWYSHCGKQYGTSWIKNKTIIWYNFTTGKCPKEIELNQYFNETLNSHVHYNVSHNSCDMK